MPVDRQGEVGEFLAHLDDLIDYAVAVPFRGHIVAVRALRQVRRAVVNRQHLNSAERRRLHVSR